MSKMIQIRNVPDELHRRLKMRAAKLGMSLSDYLLEEIREAAERPTMREWLDEWDAGEEIDLGEFDVVEAIREGRERR
jgi:plasmid stability protein